VRTNADSIAADQLAPTEIAGVGESLLTEVIALIAKAGGG